MSELAFPEIADEVVERAAPAQPAAPVGVFMIDAVRTTALAELSAVERGIADLKAKHGATDYDITTSVGYKLAEARRYAIRQVRYRVPHVVKDRKAELKGVIDALTSEGDRIAAALQAIEDPHDKLIKAEDARCAAVRAEEERKAAEAAAEAARIEAARVAGHQAFIATIRAYLTHCQKPCMTAERIANGITALGAVTVGPERQEFEAPALAAKVETLQAMHDLHAAALEAEALAAKVEAQRIENERIAADLARQAAELKRQRDEAQAVIDEASRVQLLADAHALLKRQRAEQPQAQAITASPRESGFMPADVPAPRDDAVLNASNEPQAAQGSPSGAEAEGAHAEERAPAAALPAATLKLGEIQTRMAPFSITADGLAQLGFTRQQRPGPGVHFLASDWLLIKAAAVKHFHALT